MEKSPHLALGLGLLLIAVSCKAQNQSPATIAPPPTTPRPLPGLSACQLPVVEGPCLALFTRYHFDIQSGQCNRFSYGGCQGNANNFETLQECQAFAQRCLRNFQGGPRRNHVGNIVRHPGSGWSTR